MVKMVLDRPQIVNFIILKNFDKEIGVRWRATALEVYCEIENHYSPPEKDTQFC